LFLLWGNLLWDSASVVVVGAERVRGGAASSLHSNGSDASADATHRRRNQIRTLKRRGEPVRYARLLLDEGDSEEGDGEQGRRRLPPSKVSKACSSKSLKGSKDGSAGKAGSKSKTDTRPSCDTEKSFCSCPSCTQEVLDRMAGEYTCGARMEYLLSHNSGAFSKTRQACGRVGGLEFPKGAFPYRCNCSSLAGCVGVVCAFSTLTALALETHAIAHSNAYIFGLECGECDPSTCTGRTRQKPEFYWYVCPPPCNEQDRDGIQAWT
jgi:hypothetical protein